MAASNMQSFFLWKSIDNCVYHVYTVYIKYKQYIHGGDTVAIILSNSSGKPIYEQITEQIKTDILSGVLEAGQQMPSIRTLAKELRVSVITTKRAYEELERDGFVETVQGRGTYVAHQNAQLIREEQLRRAEAKLLEAVEIAKCIGITRQELLESLTELYGGDDR